jgi:hypothetical protein
LTQAAAGNQALEFEYQRPDVEAALAKARTVDELEAAFRSVLALTDDLGAPAIYGRKLFARGLDAAVRELPRRLALADKPHLKSNDNVCIVATRLYARGGHSKVAADIGEITGAARTVAIVTDAYGQLSQKDRLGNLEAQEALQRRAAVLLASATLVEKTLELYHLLAAIRPTRIFMLTHHFDIVAAVALWPFRDVVEFLHHGDHVPALGATLPYSAHVDLTWTCHGACRRHAGPTPFYAGMTAPGFRELAGPRPGRDARRLRLATCGPQHKYERGGRFGWSDYVLAALADSERDMVHIGPAEAPFRDQLHDALRQAGVDPERYLFVGETADVGAELKAREADVYVSSYPVTGGKTNLEAMGAGLPVIVPEDEDMAPLLKFDFPIPAWTKVGDPQAFAAALARGVVGAPRGALQAEFARFEDYVRNGAGRVQPGMAG